VPDTSGTASFLQLQGTITRQEKKSEDENIHKDEKMPDEAENK
jgi:hypothetical protein